MRKVFSVASLSTIAGIVWFSPALAGMGDPSTVLREKNAICDMQRRGEGPLYPNMCLPELPVTPIYDSAPRRR
jgi:hypothetical protein